MIATDYLSRFLDNPTWPGAIVLAVAILAVAWIIVTVLRSIL